MANYGKITANSTAQLLIDTNLNRKSLFIENMSAIEKVYLGTSGVSVLTGFPIAERKQMLDNNYKGEYYVISENDAEVRYIEEEL